MGKGAVNNGQNIEGGAALAEADLSHTSGPSVFGRQTASEAHPAHKPDLTDIRAEQDLMFPKNARNMAAQQQPAAQSTLSSPRPGSAPTSGGDHHNGHSGQAVREDNRIADVRSKEREVRRHIEAENKAQPQESIGAAESRDLAVMRSTRGQAPKGTSNSNLSQSSSQDQVSVQAGGVAHQIAKTPLSASNIDSQMKFLEDGAKSTHDGWNLLKNLIPKNKENEAKVEEDMKKVREQYAHMKAQGLLNNHAEMQKLLTLMLDAGKQIDATKTAQAMGGSAAATVVTMAAGVVVVGAVSIAAAPVWVTAAVAVGVGFAARAGIKYLFKGRDEDKDLLSDAGAAVVDGAMVFVGGKLAQGVGQALSKPLTQIVSKLPGAELGAAAPVLTRAAASAIRSSVVGGVTGATIGAGRSAAHIATSAEEREQGVGHAISTVAGEAGKGFAFGAVTGAAFGFLEGGWGDKIRTGASALWAKMTGGSSAAIPAKAQAAPAEESQTSAANQDTPKSGGSNVKGAQQDPKPRLMDDDGVNVSAAERNAGDRLLRQALGEEGQASSSVNSKPNQPGSGGKPRVSDDDGINLSPSERAAADRALRDLANTPSSSPRADAAQNGASNSGAPAKSSPTTESPQTASKPQNNSSVGLKTEEPNATDMVDDLLSSMGIRVAEPKSPVQSPPRAATPENQTTTVAKQPSDADLADDLLSSMGIKVAEPKTQAPSSQKPSAPPNQQPQMDADQNAQVNKDLESIFGKNPPQSGNSTQNIAPRAGAAPDEGGGSGSGVPRKPESPKLTHSVERSAAPEAKVQPKPKAETALAEADEAVPLDQWEKDYARIEADNFLKDLGIKVAEPKTPTPEAAPAPKNPGSASNKKPDSSPSQDVDELLADMGIPVKEPAPSLASAPKTEPAQTASAAAQPASAPKAKPSSEAAPALMPAPMPKTSTLAAADPLPALQWAPLPSPAPQTMPQLETKTEVETAVEQTENIAGRYAEFSEASADEILLSPVDPAGADYAALKEELRKIRLEKNRYQKRDWKAGRKLIEAGQANASVVEDFDGDGIPDDPTLRPYYLTNKEV